MFQKFNYNYFKSKRFLLFIFFGSLISLFLINNYSKINFNFLKGKIPNTIKKNIKRKILPFQFIKDLEKRNSEIKSKYKKVVNKLSAENDIRIKKSLENLYFKSFDEKIKLDAINKYLTKYNPQKNRLSYGIFNPYPGSAYLDFYQNKLFIVSSIGIVGFSELDHDYLEFKQISNNIDKFLGKEQLVRKNNFTYNASIKDVKIFNGNIFVSLTNEIKKDCWNLTILKGNLNYKEINFSSIFSPKECISSLNKKNYEFRIGQSGGRIINLDSKNIVFSVGDFRNRNLAQNDDSFYGKILKLNIENNQILTLSKGHRNPQGLYYYKDANTILSTEHGPQGGDEINIIKISEDLQNYGWPVASYGEHYGGKNKENKNKYKKFPLLKSHSKNGFVEPLLYFSPSIGISEITMLPDKTIVFSSLKDKSLYFSKMENFKLKNLKKVYIGERIRDILLIEKSLYMYLEDSASIGKINL